MNKQQSVAQSSQLSSSFYGNRQSNGAILPAKLHNNNLHLNIIQDNIGHSEQQQQKQQQHEQQQQQKQPCIGINSTDKMSQLYDAFVTASNQITTASSSYLLTPEYLHEHRQQIAFGEHIGLLDETQTWSSNKLAQMYTQGNISNSFASVPEYRAICLALADKSNKAKWFALDLQIKILHIKCVLFKQYGCIVHEPENPSVSKISMSLASLNRRLAFFKMWQLIASDCLTASVNSSSSSNSFESTFQLLKRLSLEDLTSFYVDKRNKLKEQQQQESSTTIVQEQSTIATAVQEQEQEAAVTLDETRQLFDRLLNGFQKVHEEVNAMKTEMADTNRLRAIYMIIIHEIVDIFPSLNISRWVQDDTLSLDDLASEIRSQLQTWSNQSFTQIIIPQLDNNNNSNAQCQNQYQQQQHQQNIAFGSSSGDVAFTQQDKSTNNFF